VREVFGVVVREETTMRAMISLCAVLLIAGVGCSRTDDTADRDVAPMDQSTPNTTDPTATTPGTEPGAAPGTTTDPTMTPPPEEQTPPPDTMDQQPTPPPNP
jgi:hypothetical protein